MHAEHVLCEIRSYTNQSDTHEHGYNQLIVPLDGTLSIKTNQYDLNLDEDHIFLLPPSCRHDFYAHSTNKFIVVDIPEKTLPEFKHIELSKGIYHQMDDRWKALRVLLQAEAGTHKTDQLPSLMRYAFGFLSENRLPESLRYIEHNLEKNLSIDVLSKLEHFNPTYYNAWFKNRTGMSPMAYVQMKRIEHAKVMLKETDCSILEIGYRTGYENQASFSRAFKKNVGISPLQYRKTRDMVKSI